MLTPLLKLVIRLYQWTLGTVLPNSCRFSPTCSEYALTAITRYGPARGSLLALKRVLRCNPFFPGGYDPVPDQEKGKRSQP